MKISYQNWAIASTVATAALFFKYLTAYSSFYTSMVNLASSNWTFLVIANQLVVLSILLGWIFKVLFFGKLTNLEVETITTKTRYEAVDLLFSLTFFGMENIYSLLLWFHVLLFLKVFHWLMHSRVEWIDQASHLPLKFHVRLNACFVVLLITDAVFVRLCFSRTQSSQMFYLFSFHYAIIIAELVSYFLEYLFTMVDRKIEGGWGSKDLRMLEMEIVFAFYNFFVYVIFLVLMVYDHLIPLLLVRNLYRSARYLSKAIADLRRYTKTLKLLNETFQRITEDDLSDSDDKTCVICREEIQTGVRLPCSHIFHMRCIRSWLARQQVCPTCRTSLNLNENEALRARVREMLDNELQIIRQNHAQNRPAEGASGVTAGDSNDTDTVGDIASEAPRGAQAAPESVHRRSSSAEIARLDTIEVTLGRVASDLEIVRREVLAMRRLRREGEIS